MSNSWWKKINIKKIFWKHALYKNIFYIKNKKVLSKMENIYFCKNVMGNIIWFDKQLGTNGGFHDSKVLVYDLIIYHSQAPCFW